MASLSKSNGVSAAGEGDIGSGRAPRSKSGNDLAASSPAGTMSSLDSGNNASTASNTAVEGAVAVPASAGGNAAKPRTEFATSPNSAKSLPATRRHSGEQASAAASNAANGPAPTQSTGSTETLSSHLERLRLNAQAAKNGAQNGGVGAIGSRDG